MVLIQIKVVFVAFVEDRNDKFCARIVRYK